MVAEDVAGRAQANGRKASASNADSNTPVRHVDFLEVHGNLERFWCLCSSMLPTALDWDGLDLLHEEQPALRSSFGRFGGSWDSVWIWHVGSLLREHKVGGPSH